MPFEDLAPETRDMLRRKEIVLKPVGVQGGSHRFPALKSRATYERRRDGEVPVIKEWRLNLTRLSHVYNHYYAAYNDQIYVYEPEFPSQSLPSKPSLILSPTRTPRATRGYIDRETPHSINHLIVDFLGDLEIVLVACDDGDVIGYYTHLIQAAIDRRQQDLAYRDVYAKEVEAFFELNVADSAWGLSVHSNMRRIAVSANTRRVTLYQFSLTERKSTRHLATDSRIVLGSFGHNLPSIAFCNTDADPNAQFVAIGELTGTVDIFDAARNQLVDKFQVGFCQCNTASGYCQCGDHFPHSIWGLAWIDPRAFRKVQGYAPPFKIADDTYKDYWDGSMLRGLMPDAAPTYRLQNARAPMSDDSEDGAGDEDDEDEDDDDYLDDALMSIFEEDDAFFHERKHIHGSPPPMVHPWIANEQPLSPSGNPHKKRKRFRLLRDQRADSILFPPNRPAPLLVMTKNDISLLQYHAEPRRAPETIPRPKPVNQPPEQPIISYLDPLLQHYESGLPTGLARGSFHSKSEGRMSLHVVVAEIGALVIGTPNGRVAVFSLLRTDDWAPRSGSSHNGGTHFMRMDWLLPLKSQEDAEERPECKLLGLTAGPIQGRLRRSDGGKSRAWRLMLHYADHSILSYEMSVG